MAELYNVGPVDVRGAAEAIYTSKTRDDCAEGVCALDRERGVAGNIWPVPWQTDTCIGQWHYKVGQVYKTPKKVIDLLVDIVSKNGNLLLSIGPRADGTIPEPVRAILLDIGAWLDRNGEAIYATEPWKIDGEGPTEVKTGFATDQEMKPYTASDFRFTRKGDNLYIISLACPQDGTASIRAFGLSGEVSGLDIQDVQLLGSNQKVDWLQTTGALNIRLPQDAACKYGFALRVKTAHRNQ